MTQEANKLLFDIREALGAIGVFTDGMSFEDYLADAKTRAAVERKFEIIGEACSRLRDRDPGGFETIKGAHQIIGLRNRIIHGYDHVDDAILWDIIKINLPRTRMSPASRRVKIREPLPR